MASIWAVRLSFTAVEVQISASQGSIGDSSSWGRVSITRWVAVVWVVLICILFVLPPVAPVTVETFNYAPVAVLVVLAFATVSWFVGGRHTFMLAAKDQATSPEAEKVLDS